MIFLKKKYKLFLQNYKYFDYYKNIFLRKIKLERINIEFTNYCDLNCKYCILDNSRPKGYMDFSLFEKILKQIDNKKFKINEIALYNAGETLLHPNLIEMLNLLKKYKDKFNFKNIVLLTNAKSLNNDLSKKILETESLHKILFSIDGANKKDFENIRKGAVWENIIKNTNDFIKINNKRIKTGIISILSKENFFSEDFKNIIKQVDEFLPRIPHNWDGSKDLGLKIYNPNKGFCNHIYKTLAILWDGKVCPCCNDLNARGIIGDFNNKNLQNIYSDLILKTMMKKMYFNKRKKIILCKDCEI